MVTDELYDLEMDPGELNNLIDLSETLGHSDSFELSAARLDEHSRDPLRGYYWSKHAWRPDFSAVAGSGNDPAANGRMTVISHRNWTMPPA